jgi:NhaP-type Na+/H+ and K+/H+ antiporter
MFGRFTFASEVLLSRIAAFYGFSIPDGNSEISLADFVRTRLHGRPRLGDHISFGDQRLVIQHMDGERITKVGLDLVEPAAFCWCPRIKHVAAPKSIPDASSILWARSHRDPCSS